MQVVWIQCNMSFKECITCEPDCTSSETSSGSYDLPPLAAADMMSLEYHISGFLQILQHTHGNILTFRAIFSVVLVFNTLYLCTGIHNGLSNSSYIFHLQYIHIYAFGGCFCTIAFWHQGSFLSYVPPELVATLHSRDICNPWESNTLLALIVPCTAV